MASSPPHQHLENQICLSLYSATNAMTRAYRPFLAPLGLTYTQYLVMLALWERNHASVGEICNMTRLDTGTVTPILKRLAGKGLLARERSDVDERRRVISLTSKGTALRKRAEPIPARVACLELLTPDQGKQLKELAELLYRHATDAGD
jgi:MarR family transcriptional regulator, organic hydroperoxide resistance regulator